MIEKLTPGVAASAGVNLWLPWADVEPGAKEQVLNVASHPHTLGPVAIMPDCHQGYGVPIGTVWQTAAHVVPNAVGVDIGCGVHAIQTNLQMSERLNRDFWQTFEQEAKTFIPLGSRNRGEAMNPGDTLRVDLLQLPDKDVRQHITHTYEYQLGTLGNGNHFLEASVDEAGIIWLLVHSGSRGVGHAIGTYYAAQAASLAKADEANRYPLDLEPLETDYPIGQAYLADQAWGVRYAAENRRIMGNFLYSALLRSLLQHAGSVSGIRMEDRFDVPHNYAEVVRDGIRGRVVLHRKGATSAEDGEVGIVPGTMGTPSYIVIGKGNDDSYGSCSHGAGRQLGRGAARREISVADMQESLTGTYSTAREDTVDEAPGAYKDIDQVMRQQADLVDIAHTLRPLISIKSGVWFKGKKGKKQAAAAAE